MPRSEAITCGSGGVIVTNSDGLNGTTDFYLEIAGIHLHDGKVYRNGEQLNEPYVIHSSGDYTPYRDEFPSAPRQGQVTPEWPAVMREHLNKDGELVGIGSLQVHGQGSAHPQRGVTAIDP